MQARYALLLTFNELSQLSQTTKNELANLDPEFAHICGIPTAANPPAEPTNPRPTVQQGNTTVILPERGQVNQQNSPAYNAAMAGQMPGMPAQAPVIPTVPSAMPEMIGIPQAPQAPPQQVMAPMQAMPGMPNIMQTEAPPFQPQGVAAPQLNPVAQQFSPAPQLPQPAQQQMPMQGYDVMAVKTEVIPRQIMSKYGGPFTTSLIAEAAQHGIIPRPHLDCLDASNVNQFMHFVNTRTGVVN